MVGALVMNRKAAEIALIYSALKRAVKDIYADWGIETTDADLSCILLQSGHIRIMIRDEMKQSHGEKKESIYAEIGERIGMKKGMVKKIALGQR